MNHHARISRPVALLLGLLLMLVPLSGAVHAESARETLLKSIDAYRFIQVERTEAGESILEEINITILVPERTVTGITVSGAGVTGRDGVKVTQEWGSSIPTGRERFRVSFLLEPDTKGSRYEFLFALADGRSVKVQKDIPPPPGHLVLLTPAGATLCTDVLGKNLKLAWSMSSGAQIAEVSLTGSFQTDDAVCDVGQWLSPDHTFGALMITQCKGAEEGVLKFLLSASDASGVRTELRAEMPVKAGAQCRFEELANLQGRPYEYSDQYAEQVWSDIIMKNARLDRKAFNSFFMVEGIRHERVSEGERVSISYSVTREWIRYQGEDRFLVRMTKNKPAEEAKVTRNVYLLPQEIRQTIPAYGTINEDPLDRPLKFPDFWSAEDALREGITKKTGLDMAGEFNLQYSGGGNLYLEAIASEFAEEGTCGFGRLNLYTGEVTDIKKGSCRKGP